MAGQGPSRRELLQALGMAASASSFAGFSRWNYAFAEAGLHHHDSGVPVNQMANPAYRPQFFSPSEYQDLEALTELILPPTPAINAKPGESAMQPGAKQAGVAEFIDFMVFSDAKLWAPFRDGLLWLDRASAPAACFAKQTSAQQTALLERLAYKAKHRDSEKAGQQFFLLVRKYTVMGFYTTRAGLEALDYPGLTFYVTSPGCTHNGNPEHAGLVEERGGSTA